MTVIERHIKPATTSGRLPLRTSADDLLHALNAARAETREIRRRLLDELENYEARFGVPWSEVESRLSAGTLKETGDVCNWVIAVRAYRCLPPETRL